MSDIKITEKLAVDEGGDLLVAYENCCDYAGNTQEEALVSLNPSQRRALIKQLLVHEIHERVEICHHLGGGVPSRISFSLHGQRVELFEGGYVGPIIGRVRTSEELESLVLCMVAALQDVRRREVSP